jgi:hypothetical protein
MLELTESQEEALKPGKRGRKVQFTPEERSARDKEARKRYALRCDRIGKTYQFCPKEEVSDALKAHSAKLGIPISELISRLVLQYHNQNPL